MTSLCNYTHPELHITDGLERTDQGVVFPYNPEFYDRASGLYGPGSCVCWFLLMGSFIINMYARQSGSQGRGRERHLSLSNDLLAVVAFPVFAATDAMVQAIRWFGTEYRALAVLCVKFPDMDLASVTRFKGNQTAPLDLKEIPSDVRELGQRAIDINGPLSIMSIFNMAFFPLVIMLIGDRILDQKEKEKTRIVLRPSFSARWCVLGSYLYNLTALAVVHISFLDFDAVLLLAMMEWLTPVLLVMFWGFFAILSVCCLGALVKITTGLWTWDWKETKDGLQTFGSSIGLGVIIPLPVFLFTKLSDLTPVPDLGVSIGERDQIATLVVGVVSLCFTVLDTLVKGGKRDSHLEERDADEMQALTGAVEEETVSPAREYEDSLVEAQARRSLDRL